MNPTEALMHFLVRATIVFPDKVDRSGPCYLLMARHFNDL